MNFVLPSNKSLFSSFIMNRFLHITGFKFLVFLSAVALLNSCEDAPSPYKTQKTKKSETSNSQIAVQEDVPWHPPLNIPSTDKQDSSIPSYLRPRDSRFSVKMWRLIQKYTDTFLEYRRYLHAHPELPHREVKTGRYLTDQLKASGLKIVGPVGLTGVAAILDRGKGPVIGVVASMDGAPVAETSGLPYASRDFGYWEGRKTKVTHTQGHDIEMTISLGAAKILSLMGNRVTGKVLFIFQPAAGKVQPGEKPGAEEIIRSGILTRQKVSALFHLSLDPGLKTGKTGIPTGSIYGGITRFGIIVKSTKYRTCSGNVPWKCVDPIAVAAHLINELLILPSRHFSPEHQVILNIGLIKGGEAAHLTASKVRISGTFRWLIKSDHRKMIKLIRRIAAGHAKASNTKINVAFKAGPQTKTGNSELVSWALPTLVRSLGRKGILPADPLSEPEDFSLYAKELPTAMFLLGCSGRKRYAGAKGSSSFNPDEESVSVGIHILSNLIMDYLHSPPSLNVPKKHRSSASSSEFHR